MTQADDKTSCTAVGPARSIRGTLLQSSDFVSELHLASHAQLRRPGIRPPRRLKHCGYETAGADPGRL